MTLKILTPEWNRTVETDAVFVPGALGEFEMLRGHAPLISTLTGGDVKWREDGELKKLRVSGGVVRCFDDEIQLCVTV